MEQFQVNTKFLNNLPPEWSKFVTDVKLVKDLHTTSFNKLHAYLEQQELHENEVCLLHERNQDLLAFVAYQQMTPPHINTYQSSYYNPQVQQQFSPSQAYQYGPIHHSQHYSSIYPSLSQLNHSSVRPSHTYLSQMNHQTSSVPKVAYQSPQAPTQPMTESPLVDSSFAVPVFSLVDDLITCLNKAMAFSRSEADEELSDGGSPRVIVYGYDGLHMRLVTPPSPDYIPGLEEPQTPPVPQDEDEREPMFIQPHDPDYVSEPMYPEYILLEDEHMLLAEEQPLPLIDIPTTESPGFVTESDPEEYEDDETDDGPVDYPMDGGDDGDDDDGNSSGDDADDEDEDEEDEENEEEEHLAPTDFAIVITTAAISLPPEAKVERLLAMPTPPPSSLTSLSPPSTGERWLGAGPICMSITTTYTITITTIIWVSNLNPDTQALIDAVTAALPSPPLPPTLYIPPPVDRKDDIPETEMPPRKRLCLSTLGSRCNAPLRKEDVRS
nr:retrovirus-related Pol polyprotein from transposon TNT 1-94 [Tanacetum cinerariifolium]